MLLRGLFVGFVLLTGSLVIVPAHVAAQEVGVTWYMHGMTEPDGAGSYLDFLPPEDEADQTATCTGCAGPDPFIVASMAAEGLPGSTTTAEAPGAATVYLKSWNNAPAPMTTATVTVFIDGTEVARGSQTHDVLLGAIVQYDIELDVEPGVDLTAGAVVSWEVEIASGGCGCYNPFAYPRGVSADHAWQFTLPVTVPLAAAPEGPVVHLEEVETPAFDVAVSFENATNDTHAYNWTGPAGDLTVAYDVAVGQGSVALRVTATEGSEVLNQTVDANATDTTEATGMTEGNWTVELTFSDFIGAVSVSIAPTPPTQAPTESPAAPSPEAEPADDNETAPLNATEEAGMPGMGTMAALAGVFAALVVAARARRRH